MAGLSLYNKKRDFSLTKEPRGKLGRAKGHRFIVQRHDATRLHFDLRLELDGVYKSWAVTKVPSLDPAVKRLAVEVEDHPLDYGTFEGTIPEGQYGGGTVQLWDRGTWKPKLDSDPKADLKKGHLKVELDGERMHGGWALIRLRDKDKNGRPTKRHNWLLIKEKDDAALPGEEDALLAADTSVKTGRTLEEIASNKKGAVWNSNKGSATEARAKTKKAASADSKKNSQAGEARQQKARKENSQKDIGRVAPLPKFVEPQLARIIAEPPSGTQWAHEVKFDGYRVQARIHNGKAQLLTRRGLDWTNRFSEIAADFKGWPDCLIDGEIVALDEDGVADFAMLQDALSTGETDELVFFVFDLLWVQGRDLHNEPLSLRKQALETLIGAANTSVRIRYVEHFKSHGEAMLSAACQAKLEGIISKRLEAPYRSGRTNSWTKAKCRAGQEVVIGGWWGDEKKLRSLIVGAYKNDQLIYLGRVGTGFNGINAREVLDALKPLRQKQSPFAKDKNVPRQRGIYWVKPVKVAEVEFATITSEGLLRQASFKGLREDKTAKQVVPEAHPEAGKGELAVATKTKTSSKRGDPEICGVTITHPDKVLWPKSKTSPEVTKRELAEYYEMAADRLLPELKGRPLSMVRAPEGIEGERFFQRHKLMGAAGKIDTIKVKGEKEEFLSVQKPCDLVALGQAGVLEIHPWGSKPGEPEVPARLIFDLDPNPDVSFARVIEAAKEMKTRLEDCGLTAFVKTTGGKGIHVVTPIKGTPKSPATWDGAKLFAHVVCQTMEKDEPDKYTTNMSKKQRGGKIFLDYLRNDRMATAVAAWSPRAREGATIAMPLKWGELTAKLDPKKFTIANAKALLKRADPWKDMMKSAASLEAASRKLAKL